MCYKSCKIWNWTTNLGEHLTKNSVRSDSICYRYNWSSPTLQHLIFDKDNDQTADMLYTLRHTLNDTFIECTVNGRLIPCTEIITEAMTDGGKNMFERK